MLAYDCMIVLYLIQCVQQVDGTHSRHCSVSVSGCLNVQYIIKGTSGGIGSASSVVAES